jgi:hypothetical protein
MHTPSYHSLPESQSEENVDLPQLHCVSYLCARVVNIYRMARMGQNFDDYPGFHHNTCAKICNTVYFIHLQDSTVKLRAEACVTIHEIKSLRVLQTVTCD